MHDVGVQLLDEAARHADGGEVAELLQLRTLAGAGVLQVVDGDVFQFADGFGATLLKGEDVNPVAPERKLGRPLVGVVVVGIR